MSKLDAEEKQILAAYESGNTQRAPNASHIQQQHRRYARAQLAKDARINIRIASQDLDGIRLRAREEGIPYQTLISSILHKYVEGRLRESR